MAKEAAKTILLVLRHILKRHSILVVNEDHGRRLASP